MSAQERQRLISALDAAIERAEKSRDEMRQAGLPNLGSYFHGMVGAYKLAIDAVRLSEDEAGSL